MPGFASTRRLRSSIMELEVGQEVDLSVQRLGINGEGVGCWNGYTIFVEGLLPGEIAKVQLTEKRKNFGRARLVQSQKTSPFRIAPACPLFGKCGGCQLMHLDYKEQLQAKRQRIVDALQRIGKFLDIEVFPCEPSPTSLAYRNKIQLPVRAANVANGQGIRLGLYAYNTHELVEIQECHIHGSLGEKAFGHIRHLLSGSTLRAYCPEIRQEGIRHILLKTAVHTQEVLVVLVKSHALTPELSLFAQQLMKTMPEIKGIVHNVNSSVSNTILKGEFHTIVGQGFIEERICNLRFKVSPASFFQVNPLQAEKLYEQAVAFAEITPQDVVLDAYCGVGTLSLIAAKQAKKVVGVECVPEAIVDAQENAALNNIPNVEFHCADAEEFIPTLTNVDVALINPPRKGCESSFLTTLSSLRPRRIIYISCDPATLARDLALLCSHGYQIDKVQPFDMFPQTAHVECLVRLSDISFLKCGDLAPLS